MIHTLLSQAYPLHKVHTLLVHKVHTLLVERLKSCIIKGRLKCGGKDRFVKILTLYYKKGQM